MAQDQDQRFVTQKHFDGVIRDLRSEAREREKEIDKKLEKMDGYVDEIRLANVKMSSDIFHMTESNIKANDNMEKFLKKYDEQHTATAGRIAKLEEGSFFKKHFWTLMGIGLTGIFGFITMFFQTFGEQIGKIIFKQ